MFLKRVCALGLLIPIVVLAEELKTLDLCMNASHPSLQPLLAVSSVENPYSRAIGQRVAGFVLIGTAVLNFGLAVPMGQLMESTSGDGELWTGLVFAEGGIRAALGGVFLGIGYSKYGKWKRWQSEHASEEPAFYHLTYTFEF